MQGFTYPNERAFELIFTNAEWNVAVVWRSAFHLATAAIM